MNDMPDVFDSVNRKARKDHRCCNCYQDIKKGVSYIDCKGIWNGEPDQFRSCQYCFKIMENFKNIDGNLEYYDSPGFGDLSQWLSGFICSSWHGEEACIGMSEIFDVPVDHFRRLLGVRQ